VLAQDGGVEALAQAQAQVSPHVLAEAGEVAAPRAPSEQQHLDLGYQCVVVDARRRGLGRLRGRGRGGGRAAGPQPVLERAERNVDRLGEDGEVEVGVLLAKLARC
jgi:hypothetical protein